MIKRATVVGDGAMGTVCAVILAESGVAVRLWSNFAEQAADLTRHRENRRFLPGHRLPDGLEASADPQEAFDDPQLIVSAVPCQFIRPVWARLEAWIPAGIPVVSISKGIEVATLRLPTEILRELTGSRPLVVLSGPSIAPEVADRRPCTVVAASTDPEQASLVQRAFSNQYFRVYTNADVRGVEVAGATKNVIALASGIVDGLDAGCNAKAALLTRGLVEITRLGVAMGARAETFHGLAGIGDLVTTCMSPVGRNRSAGERIGRGQAVADVIRDTAGIIEGIPTTQAVIALSVRHGVEMPITRAVAEVLTGRKQPDQAITDLMTRQLKSE